MRTCIVCGYRSKQVWCPTCGTHHDRQVSRHNRDVRVAEGADTPDTLSPAVIRKDTQVECRMFGRWHPEPERYEAEAEAKAAFRAKVQVCIQKRLARRRVAA